MEDEEADRIRRDVEDGIRGPVLLKYVRLLLAERDELVRFIRAVRELARRAPGKDDR
jgi:hypothetical protein